MQDNKSLAEYICSLREQNGLSQMGLSKKSNIPLSQIEDIEAGKDLFLPATLRQKLAKALKVEATEIKLYERTMVATTEVTNEYIKSVKNAILNNMTENLRCPVCGSKLGTKIVEMFDMYDNLVFHPKAQCVKCPFQIK